MMFVRTTLQTCDLSDISSESRKHPLGRDPGDYIRKELFGPKLFRPEANSVHASSKYKVCMFILMLKIIVQLDQVARALLPVAISFFARSATLGGEVS